MSTQCSVYIHFPFCLRRCAYCDFCSSENRLNLSPRYLRSLEREIEITLDNKNLPHNFSSVYFGGGTPSLIPPEGIKDVLKKIIRSSDVQKIEEITVEVNPGSINDGYFEELFQTGVNRISLGMQSALERDLQVLGRIHSHPDTCRTVTEARTAGFSNISLDLIYGIPYQTLGDWKTILEKTLELQPAHISAYALTLDENVPMAQKIRAGILPPLDDDLMADMYQEVETVLEKNGFEHYEISNWARQPEHAAPLRSRHNMVYWQVEPYFGFGAGAHGNLNQQRYANSEDIDGYIHRMESIHAPYKETFPAAIEINPVSKTEEMQEVMLLGLRLTNHGVCADDFYERFGVSLDEQFGERINALAEKGLLEWAGQQSRIRLTERGRLLGNQVFMEFVGE